MKEGSKRERPDQGAQEESARWSLATIIEVSIVLHARVSPSCFWRRTSRALLGLGVVTHELMTRRHIPSSLAMMNLAKRLLRL
jgi:hypothetical protein